MEVLGDRSVIYQLEVYKKWYEEQQEEIERLNNIIDELEKYIKEEIIEGNKKPEDYKRYGLEDYVKGQLTAYVNTLNKLKELKENQ